jgi:hypothetical protein
MPSFDAGCWRCGGQDVPCTLLTACRLPKRDRNAPSGALASLPCTEVVLDSPRYVDNMATDALGSLGRAHPGTPLAHVCSARVATGNSVADGMNMTLRVVCT